MLNVVMLCVILLSEVAPQKMLPSRDLYSCHFVLLPTFLGFKYYNAPSLFKISIFF
jgi:hypothetical protein